MRLAQTMRATGYDADMIGTDRRPGPVHIINPRWEPFGPTLCGRKVLRLFATRTWDAVDPSEVTCAECARHHAAGTSRAVRGRR